MSVVKTPINVAVPFYEDVRFQDDKLKMTAPGKIHAGTILARSETGELVPYDESGELKPKAILGYNLEFTKAETKPVRVAIVGGFRKECLHLFDDVMGPVSIKTLDLLRETGLYAIATHELGTV